MQTFPIIFSPVLPFSTPLMQAIIFIIYLPFENFHPDTTKFLKDNQGLLGVSMEMDAEDEVACNKDTGEKQKTLQKWSRGLLHFVRGGGHIERWNPLFRQVPRYRNYY